MALSGACIRLLPELAYPVTFTFRHSSNMENFIKTEALSEEFLICALCSEEFEDPRSLPCLHSFCLKCLSDYARAQKVAPQGDMCCPLCRMNSTLPEGGVEALRPNHFLKSLKAFVGKASSTPKCGMCVARETAVVHCLQCNIGLCKNCKVIHPQLIATKDHTTASLEDVKAGLCEEQRKTITPFCTEHQAPRDLFCKEENCKLAICVKCKVLKHEGHFTLTLAEHSREDRINLEKLCTELNSAMKQMDIKIQEEEQEIDGIGAAEKTIHRNIDEQVQFIIKLATERGDKLKQQASDQLAEPLESHSGRLAKLSDLRSSMKHIVTMTTEVLAHSTYADLSASASAIQDQARKLLSQKLEDLEPWEAPELELGDPDTAIMDLMVGTLYDATEAENEMLVLPDPEIPKLLATAAEVNKFCMQLDDDPEVIRTVDMCAGPDGEVVILDGNDKGKRLKVFTPEGKLIWASAPGSLHSSACSVTWWPHKKYYLISIYIKEKSVYYMFCGVSPKMTQKLQSAANISSNVLCITSDLDGQLLFSTEYNVYLVKNGEEKFHHTWNRGGKRAYLMPNTCIAKTTGSSFSIVNNIGFQLWSYTSEGYALENLNICTDQFGHLFVAETNSNKVTIFNQYGDHIGSITKGIHYPWFLAVIKPGILAITELCSGLVKVYRYLK